jgi:hypothetical protein
MFPPSPPLPRARMLAGMVMFRGFGDFLDHPRDEEGYLYENVVA